MDVGLDNLADEEGDHGRLAGPRLGLGDDAAEGDDWDASVLLDGYDLFFRVNDSGRGSH